MGWMKRMRVQGGHGELGPSSFLLLLHPFLLGIGEIALSLFPPITYPAFLPSFHYPPFFFFLLIPPRPLITYPGFRPLPAIFFFLLIPPRNCSHLCRSRVYEQNFGFLLRTREAQRGLGNWLRRYLEQSIFFLSRTIFRTSESKLKFEFSERKKTHFFFYGT
jgi:hypothetical protein